MSVVNVLELQFHAVVGGHNSGLDISSAVVISPSDTYNPSKAPFLLVQTVTQNVRYTLDGTTPTTTSGHTLTAGNDPILIPVSGNTFTVIEEAATAVFEFCPGG